MTASPVRLVLDEMFSPKIAATLRDRGRDVVALVEHPELRALSDAEVYAWAAEHNRRVVTENVRDYRSLAADWTGPGVLLTSSRTFPRSRHNLGPLVDALDRWVIDAAKEPRPFVDWLHLVSSSGN